MRTKEVIKAHHVNRQFFSNDYKGNAYINAMQEYADEFACGFAEWLRDNPEYRNEFSNKLMTTPELLEIYKQQINAKV